MHWGKFCLALKVNQLKEKKTHGVGVTCRETSSGVSISDSDLFMGIFERDLDLVNRIMMGLYLEQQKKHESGDKILTW